MSTFNWDQRYLRLARMVAHWSKDPSTQCGAVLVRANRTLSSVGFNGFARGMSDRPEDYANRAYKYDHIIHSEWNSISASMDASLQGATVYAWPMPPCDECTAPLVQKGIQRVVCPRPDQEKLDRWRDAFDDAMDLWEQSNATVDFLDIDQATPYQVLHFEADKWDGRFLNVAAEVASWSKAPQQHGAVLVRPDRTVASLGFNGYPQGISDRPLIEGTAKRKGRLLPAEHNAILFSQDASLVGYTAYTYPDPPSIRAVVHLIQEGVARIVCPAGPLDPGVQAAMDDAGRQLVMVRRS